MSLNAGDRLGPYEILAPIGKGGMGDVYNACDTRLNREVAIKISHEQFSDRFEREARLYARTKRALARKEWKYAQNYADAKTAVIEEILARARLDRK